MILRQQCTSFVVQYIFLYSLMSTISGMVFSTPFLAVQFQDNGTFQFPKMDTVPRDSIGLLHVG